MIKSAKKVYLTVDSSKFDTVGFTIFAHFPDWM